MTTKNSKDISNDSHIEDIDLEIQSNLRDLKHEVQTTEPPESTEKVSEFDWVKKINPETKPEDYEKFKKSLLFWLDNKLQKEGLNKQDIDRFVIKMLCYHINMTRRSISLRHLSLDPVLMLGAQKHANYLAESGITSHNDKNNLSYLDRSEQLTEGKKYINIGENILSNAGYSSVEDMVQMRMNSALHISTITTRNNISPNKLGIGIGRGLNGKITKIVIRTAKN